MTMALVIYFLVLVFSLIFILLAIWDDLHRPDF